jgi:peptide-methionine (R)-S-oxide reductase
MTMTRRNLLGMLSAIGLAPKIAPAQTQQPQPGAPRIEPLNLPDAEWKKRLTPAQYHVLRKEGTEAAGSSPLNNEKRKGRYHCAGCDLALFTSEMKYESGTGWPSFHSTLPGVFGTKTDYKLLYPRTEYHCARCGGHHGHVFDDGPKPSGKRYCNNGVALTFVPVSA